MKLQTIRTIDISKANKQIKDLSHKFLQSKMLRKNKENYNPNTITQENAAKLLLEALRKPILRNLRELIMIKESMVYERNMFDEVGSLDFSDNSDDVGEVLKISFTNLSIKQESIIDYMNIQQTNAPIILFIVLQNIKKNKMIISFQEIKFYILKRNLISVNKRLQYRQREQLRKIIINKMKQEELLLQVYLKYWCQQTQILIYLDNFSYKIKKIYNNKLNEYFNTMKCSIKRIENRLIRLQNIKLFECKNKIYKQIEQRCPIIFELLYQFQNKLQKQSIKILLLYSFRQKRKLKSFQYGLQDLEKIIRKLDCRWGFQQLGNKYQYKKIMLLPTKYLVIILKKVLDKQKNQVLLKLNQ